jgi:hypothetical protein
MQKHFYILLLLLLGLPHQAIATREVCGDLPPSQFREENNGSIKGDLEGKANLLSRFVGKAELGGKIESTRKEIFAKYSDANAAYIDRYFAYMFCYLLFDPKNKQTPQEKLNAIIEFRQRQQQQPPPPAKSETTLNMLPEQESDTTHRVSQITGVRLPGRPMAEDLFPDANQQGRETLQLMATQKGMRVDRVESIFWSDLDKTEARQIRDELLQKLRQAGYDYKQLTRAKGQSSLTEEETFVLQGRKQYIIGFWGISPYGPENNIRYARYAVVWSWALLR